MLFFKRQLPLAIAFIFGLIGFLAQYIPHHSFEAVYNELISWVRLLYAFALILGTYSLLRLHFKRIERKTAGYGYSIILWIGFSVTFAIGMYNEGDWFLTGQSRTGMLMWIYDYIFKPAGATMFSVLAFFIASAAYRTFRARTMAAGMLLVAAIIVMIGRIPIGDMISEHIPTMAMWLMEVPNAAVKRGIFLGVALGVVATSLRIIFGIERAYLGGD